MKTLFTFLLIFTIFNDFTSASFTEVSVSHLESQVSCEESDFHSSENNHEDHDHKEHNCHSGHSHTVIIVSESFDLKPSLSELYLEYPLYQAGNLLTFISNIVRPPIA